MEHEVDNRTSEVNTAVQTVLDMAALTVGPAIFTLVDLTTGEVDDMEAGAPEDTTAYHEDNYRFPVVHAANPSEGNDLRTAYRAEDSRLRLAA